MIPKPLLYFFAAVLAGPVVFAQKPGGKPLSESDLLKQLDSLTPASAAAGAKARDAANAGPTRPFAPGKKPDKTPGEARPGADKKDQPKEKKPKRETEITSQDVTFSQKENLAIFTGNVVVVDPEFNVECDKLTAHLKRPGKPAPLPTSPDGPGKSTLRPATPKPEGADARKSGSGLEMADAESTSDRRVKITQDKRDKTGIDKSGELSIGLADKAHYDAVKSEVTLTGSPEVQQGTHRIISTSPETIMILNRDGNMRAIGPTRTIIEKDQ